MLKGTNQGEWGGELVYEPKGHKEHTVKIMSGNIRFLFQYNNKICFLEGLAHLTSSHGALYELEFKKDSFTYTKRIDFEDEPAAYCIYKDRLLVATYANFFEVKNWKIEPVILDIFWKSLYPNSVAVIDEKHVFVGLRSGIAKIDLTTKKITYYKWQK